MTLSLAPSLLSRALPFLILGAALTVPACGNSPDDSTSTGAGGTTGEGGSGDGDGDSDPPEYVPTGAACEFGDNGAKCDRDDALACTPVLAETGAPCDRDDDCNAGELCFVQMDTSSEAAGVCMRLYGECLEPMPTKDGAGFGESCEEDSDCAGTCVEVDDPVFECEEHCRIGATNGCGHDDMAEAGVACAFFAFDLDDFGADQGEGDVGICAYLCDCTEDCPGEQKCFDNPTNGFPGVCTGGDVPDELTECPDMSAGGSRN